MSHFWPISHKYLTLAVNTITVLTICIQEKLQMTTKFEKLLDYLINEETDKANALFHQIVVEKSRKIYENLMTHEMGHMSDGMYDEDQFDEMSDDSMEEEVYELADDGMLGGDGSDNFVDEVDVDDTGGNMDMGGSQPASKEDVMDIKDALADLKAEFEALLSKEDDMDMDMDMDDEDEFGDMDDMGDEEDDMDDEEDDMDDMDDMGDEEDDMDMDDEEDDMDMDDEEDDMDMDDEEDEDDEDEDMEEAFIREYREVIEKDPFNPKGNSEHSGTNTKSPINANPKNRPSGGNVSAHNIAQGGEEGKVTVAKPKGQFVQAKTLNVGGTQAKDGYKHKQSAKSADKGGVNAKSVVPK